MSIPDFALDSDDDFLVDFEPEPTKPIERKFEIKYNDDTREFYRVLRSRQMCPITHSEMDPKYAFIFKEKWDPYTGERLGDDPDGALYFDPDSLIKTFYTNRLRRLWNKQTNEQGGIYQGYYDDGVGAGEDFYVAGRGNYPEWYIFRLPILDCYLTDDHNHQVITMGPKLTNDEIEEIEEKANLRPNNYKKLFGKQRPPLRLIKQLYDKAIARDFYIPGQEDMTDEEVKNIKNKINMDAVIGLINIPG